MHSLDDTYADHVAGLTKSGSDIKESLSAADCYLIHMSMGVSGESGELLDAVKKHVIYRKPLDVLNVVEELGDLEFYMEGLRQAIGVTRDDVLRANIAKLRKRYNGGYSDAAAKLRADKEGEAK